MKPGVYEGGLKLWECAIDLTAFLSQLPEAEQSQCIRGGTVLEAGCGHALPGIYALQSGARCVHFQDYNSEALEAATVPNIILNCCQEEGPDLGRAGKEEDKKEQRQQQQQGACGGGEVARGVCCQRLWETMKSEGGSVRLFNGDWDTFTDLVTVASSGDAAAAGPEEEEGDEGSGASSDVGGGGGVYDLILSSDTLYSSQSQEKLLRLLQRTMRYPAGRAYFAAKSYYFGVGGGTKMFADLLRRAEPTIGSGATAAAGSTSVPAGSKLEVQQVWKCEDGSSNVREILEVTWASGTA